MGYVAVSSVNLLSVSLEDLPPSLSGMELFYSEDGSSKFFQHVGNDLLGQIASHLRTQ
jgi:hypothetical protein